MTNILAFTDNLQIQRPDSPWSHVAISMPAEWIEIDEDGRATLRMTESERVELVCALQMIQPEPETGRKPARRPCKKCGRQYIPRRDGRTRKHACEQEKR